MTHALKPSEMKDIENFLNTSPVAKQIRQYNSWTFEVGDVLVKYKTDWQGSSSVEQVSTTCPVPRKFKIIYIDKERIPWVKQVSVRGGLSNKLICLINHNQPNTTWEVDPEQAEALLLGYPYDPRAEYKNMRTENPAYGGNAKKAKDS